MNLPEAANTESLDRAREVIGPPRSGPATRHTERRRRRQFLLPGGREDPSSFESTLVTMIRSSTFLLPSPTSLLRARAPPPPAEKKKKLIKGQENDELTNEDRSQRCTLPHSPAGSQARNYRHRGRREMLCRPRLESERDGGGDMAEGTEGRKEADGGRRDCFRARGTRARAFRRRLGHRRLAE